MRQFIPHHINSFNSPLQGISVSLEEGFGLLWHGQTGTGLISSFIKKRFPGPSHSQAQSGTSSGFSRFNSDPPLCRKPQ